MLRRVDTTFAFAGGEPVVAVPVHGANDWAIRCLRSIMETTPPSTRILVVDDADPEGGALAWLEKLDGAGDLGHDVHWLRLTRNVGFPAAANVAFEAAGRGDVILVNSDVIVLGDWLERLTAAALSDDAIATATPLTNHGSIASIPERNTPSRWDTDLADLEKLAGTADQWSKQLRPSLPTAIGHLVYVRRSALDLVGPFDLIYSPGYGEEVDFSQRCIRVGLRHVLADDVVVFHAGGASLEPALDNRRGVKQRHEALLVARYPYYHAAVRASEAATSAPLAQAIAAAVSAMRAPRIVVDGRCLASQYTGTQAVTVHVAKALMAVADARLLVPDRIDRTCADAIAELPWRSVARITDLEDRDTVDVIHRPYQVASQQDLELLLASGARVVLSQLDFLAYDNAAYFPSGDAWLEYRDLTARALHAADAVVTLSNRVGDRLAAEQLVDRERTFVVPPGHDGDLDDGREDVLAPADVPSPFLLVVGTDFHHKNRAFALQLFHALAHEHSYRGSLVLAGPTVRHGSSTADERAFLRAHPELAHRVVHLGWTRPAEKRWLVANADLVLYPSTDEGYGLVPFEAARHGVATAVPDVAIFRETLPTLDPLIVPWDTSASAERVAGALASEGTRARLVAAVDAAGTRRWSDVARDLVAVYEAVRRMPPAVPDAVKRASGGYYDFRGLLGENGAVLAGPRTPLSPQGQYVLARLLDSSLTKRPLVSTLHGAYVAGAGVRRLFRRAKGERR